MGIKNPSGSKLVIQYKKSTMNASNDFSAENHI